MSVQRAKGPGVIPYVEYYAGATRVLTVTIDCTSVIPARVPMLSIDGREYLVLWNVPIHVEIPSERPTHVAVYIDVQGGRCGASLLLAPGWQPAGLAAKFRAGGSCRLTLSPPTDPRSGG